MERKGGREEGGWERRKEEKEDRREGWQKKGRRMGRKNKGKEGGKAKRRREREISSLSNNMLEHYKWHISTQNEYSKNTSQLTNGFSEKQPTNLLLGKELRSSFRQGWSVALYWISTGEDVTFLRHVSYVDFITINTRLVWGMRCTQCGLQNTVRAPANSTSSLVSHLKVLHHSTRSPTVTYIFCLRRF